MSKNTSVTLGESYQKFIERQIARGRFGSASEAIRAGLQLLEERENELERLRAAIDEGDKADDVPDFDFDQFLARMNDK
jgi:antitoxin ParD1/3/4